MIKYFLYSDEQIIEKNKVLAQTGKKFEPGFVTIGNRREKFTQLSNTPTMSRFVDSKIIASGEESNFTYTLPKSVEKRS